MAILSKTEWDLFLNQFPDAHILQTSEWGSLKELYGWRVNYFQNKQAGCQVLLRKLPFGYSIAYIPKGPVGTGWHHLWHEIDEYCINNHAFMMKVEPDIWLPSSFDFNIQLPSFRANFHVIQPRRTLAINLDGTENQWFQNMKQKTRYNIRLAMKKGVVVQPSNNFIEFEKLLKETSARDKFGVHNINYYQRIYKMLYHKNECTLLMAKYDDNPIASIMVFARGQRAWYFYGASSNEYRNLMAPYLLQWEGMKWAAARGCKTYDLWGVPDEDEETLEENFLQKSQGLWGVYRFKRGFGGQLIRSVGAYDKVYNPFVYNLYRLLSKFI